MTQRIDLSKYHDSLTLTNKLLRLLWNIVYWIFFRPFIGPLFYKWRIFILRSFGAKIDWSAHVYAGARIWAPWNLVMGKNSCLSSEVDCYNVDIILIGNNVVVSQKAYLCTASHDITNVVHPLITYPITIKDQSWVAAGVFIGMGVTIGEGAVVGARSVVTKNIEPWTVVGGNPARFIKKRIVLSNEKNTSNSNYSS